MPVPLVFEDQSLHTGLSFWQCQATGERLHVIASLVHAQSQASNLKDSVIKSLVKQIYKTDASPTRLQKDIITKAIMRDQSKNSPGITPLGPRHREQNSS